MGRIGTHLLRCIKGFDPLQILVNDIKPDNELSQEFKLKWVTKEQIYNEADLISLHLPLTSLTKNMIRREQLLSMKSDAMIINTSRGGIINERDLHDVMVAGHLSGAAIDVFEHEPIDPTNPLSKMDNVVLTPHIAGITWDTWSRRAKFAYSNMQRVWKGEAPQSVAQ